MNNNIMTPKMTDRLFSAMKAKGVNTSDLCKVLNVNYCNFKTMCDGLTPCYGKWQKKIANVLGMDREILFCEFKNNSCHEDPFPGGRVNGKRSR